MCKQFFHKAFVIALFVTVLGLGSCEIIKGPNFSNTPKISFKEFKVWRNYIESKLGNRVDSVVIVINFEDGDGDLGLTSEDRDTNPIYKQFKADGTPNKYWNNYFAKAFRKVNGTFVEASSEVQFSGAFPPLKPDGKPGPIEGELEYGLYFPLSESPVNDTLLFEVQIVDKALNESNIIRTGEVVINPK